MDGLLTKINYDFLKELENRGLVSSYIKFKFLSRDANLSSIIYKTSQDFATYTESNKDIIFDRRYLCYAGNFPVIENLILTNNNLSFKNKYAWYNITDKRFVVKTIDFDIQRNLIYENEIQRYLDLMYSLFDTYTKNVNTALQVRLNSYVDPCYVDAGYISPNSDPVVSV